jgi:hypothetical protein
MTNFLDRMPLRALFDLPPALIDQAKSLAYQCHRSGRPEQTEILCRGLIAADHRCWWTHALYASALRDTGRPGQALDVVEHGLRYQPGHPTLLALEEQLTAALAPAGSTPPGRQAGLPEAA